MEGLMPATAMATASTFQLILEHLCAILLLISEGLGHVPALPAFLSVILVGALVVVSLMVKGRLTSGSVKAPEKRCPAGNEVCAGRGENTGPMTEADDTPKPPGLEASPLWLQTLCLRALNEHLSRMSSLQDLADLVRTVRRTQPPRRSHVTDEKPVTKALGTDREQLQNMPGDLNKNTHHPESPELCQDETVGRKQDVQDKEEEKQGLDPSMAPVERDLQGTVSQPLPVGGVLLQTSPRPEVLRGHLAQVKSQVERPKEAGNADQSVHESEGDLKGVPHVADLNVSLPSTDKEDQGRARELWEQKQVNEELTAEIMSLQTEKASLQCENADLNAEIQQLKRKLKLRVQPDTYEDRLAQLQKQLFEAEGRCSEMEKKLLDDWRNMKSTYQMLDTYKKMAQDMNQELRRSSFYYEKEIRYHWERAEAARTAADHTERKLQELRRESDRNRQLLAQAKSTFWPFPGGPFAPAAPPAAYRSPEVPVRPLGHRVPRKEQGHTVTARTQAHLQV